MTLMMLVLELDHCASEPHGVPCSLYVSDQGWIVEAVMTRVAAASTAGAFQGHQAQWHSACFAV
jgi:hypothetical protein